MENRDLDSDSSSHDSTTTPSLRSSLRAIFRWRNYSVYLVTSWIFNGFIAVQAFLTLYLWILGWDSVVLGSIISATTVVGALSRLAGGYIGDIVDRKRLSVIAFFLASIYFLIMGLSVDFLLIVLALMTYSVMDVARGGSSAYIMDNIPKEHSGLGLSLFTAGRSFGIIALIAFWFLLPLASFVGTFQLLSLIGGISLILCTLVRARYLTSSTRVRQEQDRSLQDFISANSRAVKMVFTVMPGVMLIAFIDAMSDSLFRFGALIYSSGFVNASGIVVITLFPLLVSLPLVLKVGRISDRYSIKRVGLLVYSIMPFSAALMFLASYIPYWAPSSIIEVADAVFSGLGAVFSMPFSAMILKQVNDTLWWLVVLTVVQKSLPRSDTSKILAIFWFVVYIGSSLGPFIGGLIFEYVTMATLFLVALALNVIILLAIWGGGLLAGDGDSGTATRTPGMQDASVD